jgi:hypothetical protein
VSRPSLPLYRKDRPPSRPITAGSIALFRLGEQCNNACPMCSNTGRPEAFFIDEPELLRRVERLAGWGFRRVFLTGGEPTIHPAFWRVVDALAARAIAFDLNTHGRSFAEPHLARRARERGLGRAIVSFHSHLVEASCAIFGTTPRGHEETLAGIAALADAGAELVLNCVLSTVNLPHLDEWVRFSAARFPGAALKLAFPSTLGKGGGWAPIQIRYADAAPALARARAAAEACGAALQLESFPSCVLVDARVVDSGRSGSGESHYLEDLRGEELFAMDHIEAELSVYAAGCLSCAAFAGCPGVSELYAQAHGTDELVPFAR